MSSICFASDWIIEKQGISQLGILFDISKEHGCKLQYNGFILENGLQGVRFMVYAPSRSVLDTFIAQVRQNTVFSVWFQVDLEEYPEPNIGMADWDWSIRHAFIDGLLGSSLDNNTLKKSE